jgi:DNA-binding NarL/FixJ family response regulator
MRVVIAESSLRDGRKLAAEIESLLPSADVLLYSDPDAAIAGIKNHLPDVVVTAPKVGGVDGPDFLARVRDLDGIDAKLVGGVDQPDADMSIRYVDAGAALVVLRPVNRLSLRAALRHRGAGIS